MRIVGLDEFLRMPEGTVFAKYSPCVFEDLQIKGDTLGEIRDFTAASLSVPHMAGADGSNSEFEILDRIEADGTDHPVELNLYGRDGCFEPAQLFAVWSDADVALLIARLADRKKVGIPTAE